MNKSWDYVRLDELCDIRIGRTPRRDTPMYWGGTAVWVTISELSGGVISESKEHVSDLAVKEIMPEPIPTGTLLFSFKLSIGKMGIAGCPLYTNEAIAALVIRDSNQFSRDFLKYALEAVNHSIGANTAVLGKVLNKEKVSAIQIPRPLLPEQERIVRLLDEAESLRATRERANVRMEQFVPALFQEMFGDLTVNDKGWEFGQVFELCEKIIDCPHATPIHSSTETEFASIRSSDIQNGYLDFSTTKYVEYDEYVKRIARGTPTAGDVVYCREGARFGNAALIPENLGKKICLGQRMMLFRVDHKKATPEFLWAMLESAYIRKQAESKVGGSASPHVNVNDIKKFTTIIPPLALQREFARRVEAAREVQSAQGKSAERIEALYQSMLSRAFAGEL